MTARYATKNALLGYLRVDGDSVARVAIYRYMFGIGVSVPATREQLRRLVAAGVVCEVTRGHYQATEPG